MADNVDVTAGSGTTVAADEVVDGTLGTVKVQYVKLMDGTLDGTTKAAVGANGLAADVKAVVPGTGATALGKAEDAAHADGDVGVMGLAVRKNTAASTSGSDGDYQPLITNTTGHLWVDASGQTLTVGSHAVTNAGTFAVQDSEKLADNAGFTDGTTKVLPAGFIYDDIAGTALTENDVAAGRIDSKRAMVMVIEDGNSRGQRATVSAANALKVTVGTGATDLGKSEDNAHSSSDTGVLSLFVRSDTPTSTSGTDGDYTAPITGSRGEHWVGLVGHNTTTRISVATSALTTATTLYTAGDVLNGEMSIANAVRISGGRGVIEKVVAVDKSNNKAASLVELWFFQATSSSAADNAASSWADANMDDHEGVIALPSFTTGDSALNRAVTWLGAHPFQCAATTLFCVPITRTTHAAHFNAATDLVFKFQIRFE